MRKLLLFFLIIVSANLQNCANVEDNIIPSENNGGENNGGNSPTTTANLPIKITSSTNIIEIKYDNQDRFIEILKKDHNGYLKEKSIFIYKNDSLKNIKMNSYAYQTENNRFVTFNYSNDTIYVTSEGVGFGINFNYLERLAVNNEGMLLYIKGITPSSDRSFNNDANGNIIFFDNLGHQGTLSYDSSNGIFKSVKLPYWSKAYILGNYISYSLNYNYENNVLSVDYKSNAFVSEEFYYEYNQQNYPERVLHKDNWSEEFEIEYSK